MTSSTSKNNVNDDDLTITVVDNDTQKGGLSRPLQPPIILDNIRPLSSEIVNKRLETYGSNIISTYQPLRWYTVLYHSTVHPFNAILISLATFSGATGDFPSFVILLVMVILSVGIRFVQEYKSEVATQALKKMVNNKATVIRLYSPPDNRDPNFEDLEKMDRGETIEMDITLENIVPGDWVRLSAGDLIPGDVQLISSKDLFVSQASLTGESIPVEKFTTLQQQVPIIPENITSTNTKMNNSELDQPNLCFMGTSVVSGTATAVVLKTGPNTFFGAMAKKLSGQRTPNAFQKSIRRVSYMFVCVMLSMMPPVLLLQGFLKKDWKGAIFFAAAVAVGLTPEMLPMIVNANLARGAIVLSKKKCIVKKLDSIINLGGMDILCTDKTGTLTRNKVVLIKHLDYLGNECKLPLYLGYLNSYFQTGLKNLLDVAVIEFFDSKNEEGEAHLNQNFFKVDEIPFDFIRRRMSVILESNLKDDCRFLISKGAVDEMLTCCTNIYIGKGDDLTDVIFPTSDIVPITPEILENMKNLNEKLNDEGLRVIAIAFKDMNKCSEFTVAHESELTLVGVCAFLDPPKPSAKPALQELFKYNVEIKVLTGDSPAVCRKVCEEINLPIKSIVTTTELEDADDAKLEEIAESGTIFAKLTPIQKANIVKALKRRNHIVGFLGDGINDAPAIRESDCGISVDEGTDIAKESADIILLEKNLMVLADGVVRGRITFGNTIKYIKMAISSNFGNVLSVLVASAWLPFLPMESIQIILQNLLYDFSQISIPWDKMDPEYLIHPKRWSAKSIIKFMVFTGPWNSIFDMTTFVFMLYYYKCQDPNDTYKVHLFQTAWFVEGLITQTLIVHMIRTPKIPFVQSTASLPVCLSTPTIIFAAIIITFSPLNKYLNMVPLPGLYFAYLLGVLTSYWFLTSFVKWAYIKIFKEWL